MVFKGSRYATVDVIQPVRADGKRPRVLADRPIPSTPGVLLHTVTEGERLDQLAAQFYSESTKYWVILDANLDQLNPFDLLQAGRAIKIPRNRIVP